MSISGVSNNPIQIYQSIRATQQSQVRDQQTISKVNQSTQLTNSLDPDHDGDIDGKGKDIDVRI
ncbi:MAG: hypothetical protein Q8934_20435 [Bacillota bacterium]|nr:hypothetical protein [Bacillota bacterium]